MASKKKKPAKKARPSPVRKMKAKPPARIEENRNGVQPAYVGDQVWWDDDEDDFTGLYDVSSVGEDPEDQH